MIPNREGLHFLAVKKLSQLLRGITSKYDSDFFSRLNCLHSFTTRKKLKSHKKVCENKDFGSVVMPSKDTKILEFNQYQESYKILSLIYVDLESLIKRTDGCKNKFEKSSTKK